MAYGNIAMDLISQKQSGRLVVLKEGRYSHIPIETITSTKKVVDVKKYYDSEQLRPIFDNFEGQPIFLMGSEL